jgi:hypothetical protein
MHTLSTGIKLVDSSATYVAQLRALEENPRALRLAATKATTLRQYLGVCGDHGLECLPLRYVTVALFLVWFVREQKGRTATMAAKKSHLKTTAELMDVAWLSKQDIARLAAIEKELRCQDVWTTNRKEPLVARVLKRMMDLHQDGMVGGLLVRTMYALSHDGLLRSGEIARGLRVTDVEVSTYEQRGSHITQEQEVPDG